MPSNNLKKLRKDKKLTLTALSERSGVSIAQIWNIENKPGTPRRATMAALAKGLGCRVSTVFPDTKPANDSKATFFTGPGVDPEDYLNTRLNQLLSNRKPGELNRIVKVLEAAFPR
jgi:transcriptional regulator with XRE-family HTH domain